MLPYKKGNAIISWTTLYVQYITFVGCWEERPPLQPFFCGGEGLALIGVASFRDLGFALVLVLSLALLVIIFVFRTLSVATVSRARS